VTFEKYKKCKGFWKILRTKRWSKAIKFKSKNVMQMWCTMVISKVHEGWSAIFF
jgi:hypothetical protein